MLVTGGAGFIGSHLAEAAARPRLMRVTVVDDESTGSAENLAAVRDARAISASCMATSTDDDAGAAAGRADVDEVYHLAAAVGVQLIATAPIETIERNIYPTELLLAELAAEASSRQAGQILPGQHQRGLRQEPQAAVDRRGRPGLRPDSTCRWSYGASKAIDEFLALAYHRQHRLAGRDRPLLQRRRPAADRALRHGAAAVRRRGARRRAADGPRRRPAGALLRPREATCAGGGGTDGEPQALGEVFNIGSDQPVSILELAQRVLAIVDPSLGIEFQSYRDAYRPISRTSAAACPSSTKLRRTIEVKPETIWTRSFETWWSGNRRRGEGGRGRENRVRLVFRRLPSPAPPSRLPPFS